ncbi:hypothetical protein [Deinococcus carri]|uniref:hypothetical protein n=1 Tax=Deinococcus carri TaxID=1211323 RepID=UPI0031E99C14
MKRSFVLTILLALTLPTALAAPAPARSKAQQIATYRVHALAHAAVTPATLAASGAPVQVTIPNDYLYKRDLRVNAYRLDDFLRARLPDLDALLARDAVVMLYCADGYAPMAKLRDLVGAGGLIAVGSPETDAQTQWPAVLYKDKPLPAAQIGNYLVWENFRYPQKPQPWGLVDVYVLPAGSAVK